MSMNSFHTCETVAPIGHYSVTTLLVGNGVPYLVGHGAICASKCDGDSRLTAL